MFKLPKFSISFLGVILGIILVIVLILLGERFIFDLNRWANPVLEKQDYRVSSMIMEKSRLAPGVQIYYPTTDKGKYLTYKLLIHAAFIIPIFLLVFLLYYLVKIKEQKPGWRMIIYAYMLFAFWMLFHLLGEAIRYISYQYKSAAIYIVLVLLAVILTPLAIFLQKKHSEKIP